MDNKLVIIFFLFYSSLAFSQNMDTTNTQLITKFYTAFQNKDYKTMQECYTDTATFSDAVFVNLNAAQTKAMWEMLCIKGKDLVLTFNNIQSQGNTASAEWEAHYTFSATKRKVINNIKANFIIENGKIIKHNDSFDLYKWSKQAIGLPAVLLGRTSFFQNKIRKTAMKSLHDFMSKKK